MEYYASGKLLLFGEYLVLRGAQCLAIPLKYGQSMTIGKGNPGEISWIAKADRSIWFSATFNANLEIIEASNEKKARQILLLLNILKSHKDSSFLSGVAIKTQTDFPTEWGFGTSSTLISLLAQWSGVNPFLLLEKSFGGSGYDVACATADSPVFYRAETHEVQTVDLSEAVTSKILFVYSGRKQETSSEVKRFDTKTVNAETLNKMNRIVKKAAITTDIAEFEKAMEQSEQILAPLLDMQPIKNEKFADYPFAIKSLGAWGGDFFMATFRDETAARHYFQNRGYPVQFNYDQLIKA